MRNKKKVVVKAGLVSGLVVALVLLSLTMPVPVNEEKIEGTWHTVWKGLPVLGNESIPSSNQTVLLGMYFCAYTANPETYYLTNDSGVLENKSLNGSAWTYGQDEFRIEMAHSTNFDIICRVRFNDSVKYGGDFYDARCRVNITLSGDETVADQNMTGIWNTSDMNNSAYEYLYIVYHSQNIDGDGFVLSENGEIAITEVKIEAYY